LTTEEVEIFHRDLSTMTIQDTLNQGNGRFDPLVISLFENKLLFHMQCSLVNYVSIVDLIIINEIEDACDYEDMLEYDDVSIDINEVNSISLTFNLNFALINTKEHNAYIQPK
jgi:hypothetical protein